MRVVIGAMTGTSIDGIDTVVAGIDGIGLEMRARVLVHRSDELGPVAEGLRRAAKQEPLSAGDLACLALQLGERLAEAIDVANIEAGAGVPDLVAVHGQTVVHKPPLSWQLVNPAPIATRLRCPVVFDLRQADLAAGGQGAPITPLADWVLFRQARTRRAVVNLGGFCNATIVTPDLDDVLGFDVCVCNQVLDAVAHAALGASYDQDGRAARSGRSDDDAAQSLRATLDHQRSLRRSLGTGDEAEAWVTAHAQRLPGADLAATAVAAVSGCITAAVGEHDVQDVVLAGGGARNLALVEAIQGAMQGQQAAPGTTPVVLSNQLGVPVEAREALAMAILGTMCADGVPITLPHVTGGRAPAPLAGTWCSATRGRPPTPAP
jgi:1,6-anhydro-N-acetylmuramate kinase